MNDATGTASGAVDILNNLDEYDIVEEIDESAMITDTPPPPEPGQYQIRLNLATDAVKPPKLIGAERFPAKCVGTIKSPGHLQIVFDQEVIDPSGAKHRQQRDWFNTMVMQSVKTSAVDTLLRAITGRAGVGMTNKAKIEMLYDLAAAGQALAYAEVDWEAESIKVVNGQPVELTDADGHPITNQDGTPKYEYATSVVGGKRLNTSGRFPVDEAGKRLHADLVDDNGNPVYVRWYVKRWLSPQGV